MEDGQDEARTENHVKRKAWEKTGCCPGETEVVAAWCGAHAKLLAPAAHVGPPLGFVASGKAAEQGGVAATQA